MNGHGAAFFQNNYFEKRYGLRPPLFRPFVLAAQNAVVEIKTRPKRLIPPENSSRDFDYESHDLVQTFCMKHQNDKAKKEKKKMHDYLLVSRQPPFNPFIVFMEHIKSTAIRIHDFFVKNEKKEKRKKEILPDVPALFDMLLEFYHSQEAFQLKTILQASRRQFLFLKMFSLAHLVIVRHCCCSTNTTNQKMPQPPLEIIEELSEIHKLFSLSYFENNEKESIDIVECFDPHYHSFSNEAVSSLSIYSRNPKEENNIYKKNELRMDYLQRWMDENVFDSLIVPYFQALSEEKDQKETQTQKKEKSIVLVLIVQDDDDDNDDQKKVNLPVSVQTRIDQINNTFSECHVVSRYLSFSKQKKASMGHLEFLEWLESALFFL